MDGIVDGESQPVYNIFRGVFGMSYMSLDKYAQSFNSNNYETLDGINLRSFTKIYCSCGRIVGLDPSEVILKHKLGKELQCITCRNLRISQELDSMNEPFDSSSETDEMA